MNEDLPNNFYIQQKKKQKKKNVKIIIYNRKSANFLL